MTFNSRSIFFIFSVLFFVAIGCQNRTNKTLLKKEVLSQFKDSTNQDYITTQPDDIKTPEGMVWIPGGKFVQGALDSDNMAMNHEKPAHEVVVDGFFIDITELTNAKFQEFVNETGYITVAERAIDWEIIKEQLPLGTTKPADSLLQPGSLTFRKTKESVPNLYDYSQWWNWTIGANWKHPDGPESTINGKENYPVVHIAYEDAIAYCEWAGRRLPTEAEWEYAARGGQKNAIFTWGKDFDRLSQKTNTWEGEFPTSNTLADGFEGKAPVQSYSPNPYGLYDMAGNVWEFTNDWYDLNYYKELSKEAISKNPLGAAKAYNPNAMAPEKVIKGGSYLCNAAYCASFRISARMANALDSSQEHLGFRTVVTLDMIEKQLK